MFAVATTMHVVNTRSLGYVKFFFMLFLSLFSIVITVLFVIFLLLLLLNNWFTDLWEFFKKLTFLLWLLCLNFFGWWLMSLSYWGCWLLNLSFWGWLRLLFKRFCSLLEAFTLTALQGSLLRLKMHLWSLNLCLWSNWPLFALPRWWHAFMLLLLKLG